MGVGGSQREEQDSAKKESKTEDDVQNFLHHFAIRNLYVRSRTIIFLFKPNVILGQADFAQLLFLPLQPLTQTTWVYHTIALAGADEVAKQLDLQTDPALGLVLTVFNVTLLVVFGVDVFVGSLNIHVWNDFLSNI